MEVRWLPENNMHICWVTPSAVRNTVRWQLIFLGITGADCGEVGPRPVSQWRTGRGGAKTSRHSSQLHWTWRARRGAVTVGSTTPAARSSWPGSTTTSSPTSTQRDSDRKLVLTVASWLTADQVIQRAVTTMQRRGVSSATATSPAPAQTSQWGSPGTSPATIFQR